MMNIKTVCQTIAWKSDRPPAGKWVLAVWKEHQPPAPARYDTELKKYQLGLTPGITIASHPLVWCVVSSPILSPTVRGTNQYEDVLVFLEEETEPDVDGWLSTDRLYSEYREWCKRLLLPPLTKRRLFKGLRAHGFFPVRRGRAKKHFVPGLRFRSKQRMDGYVL